MPCYKPIDGWRQLGALKPNEKRIVFSRHQVEAVPLTLPCGQCIGCRLERSRRWAVRLMHEASLHDSACFLTLTYSDEHVPSNGSLNVADFQRFMKRLRRGSSSPLRYFHCGEYGEQTARPHYHCILFGEDFATKVVKGKRVPDRVLLKKTERGDHLYSSSRLSEVWGLGHVNIGDVTFESAAYVARYCLKKLTVSKRSSPEDISKHKSKYFNSKTGEWLKPEYVTMSRRPGIGGVWFNKFHRETYRDDSVVMRGLEMMPPPFYDKLLEKVDPSLFQKIKSERSRAQKETKFSEAWGREMTFTRADPNSSSRRLLEREAIKSQTIKQTLKRSL